MWTNVQFTTSEGDLGIRTQLLAEIDTLKIQIDGRSDHFYLALATEQARTLAWEILKALPAPAAGCEHAPVGDVTVAADRTAYADCSCGARIRCRPDQVRWEEAKSSFLGVSF